MRKDMELADLDTVLTSMTPGGAMAHAYLATLI